MDESQNSDQGGSNFNTGSPRSASGQVMDIQSPKSASDTAPNLPSFPTDLSSETEDTSSANVANPQVATEPVADSAEPLEESAAEATTSAEAETTDANPASQAAPSNGDQPADPAHNPLAIPPHASHKSGAPVVAIVVAIVVALALAALVAFTFMKSKSKTTPSVTNSSTTQTTAKPLASPADVDATNKDLETSLSKIDESKDFSTTELSDKSLGL